LNFAKQKKAPHWLTGIATQFEIDVTSPTEEDSQFTRSLTDSCVMTDKEDPARPLKRPRTDPHNQNGSVSLPPLSLSILGVEPMDEFIREVADFVYHMISTRPPDSARGVVEVEAKIGILKDKISGHRLALPVTTETGEYRLSPWL
jgi:mRNA capping enzyme, beta chain